MLAYLQLASFKLSCFLFCDGDENVRGRVVDRKFVIEEVTSVKRRLYKVTSTFSGFKSEVVTSRVVPDPRFDTLGPACFDQSGTIFRSASKATLATRGYLADLKDKRFVATERGFHISSAGTVGFSDIPWEAQIGDRGDRVKDAVAVATDPIAVAVDTPLQAFGHFAHKDIIYHINAIDWSQVPLPGDLAPWPEIIHHAGFSLGQILYDIGTGAWATSFVLPALRLYAYYTQVECPAHTPFRVYNGSKVDRRKLPELPEYDYQALAALRAYSEFNGDRVRAAVDPSLYAARLALRPFNDEDAGQRALLASATAQALEIATNAGKPKLYVSNDVGEVTCGLLAKRFPEFHTVMASSRHTHGALAASRHALSALAFAAITKSNPNALIRTIGATDAQVARLGNVIHNCAPIMSGRDEYRHYGKSSAQDRLHAQAITCRSKFQDCQYKVTGAVGFAPHSLNDISVNDFVLSMVQKGMRRSFGIINLPIPMMDDRITNCHDEWNQTYYEKVGDKLRMYHTAGAAAGYTNSFATTMSWCRPIDIFPGLNVTIEEYRSFGFTYLLEITIGIGEQEEQPMMWQAKHEQYYILPLCIPRWREPTVGWFTVPRHRFEQITEFAMGPGSKQDIKTLLAQKTRGQQAEIKIGGHVVEPRWTMSVDEFNAVIMHAKLAAKMRQLDSDQVEDAWAKYFLIKYARHGVYGRIMQALTYVYCLVTLQLTGITSPLEQTGDGFISRWFFATRFDRTQMPDFYTPAGSYRTINERTVGRCPRVTGDLRAISDFISDSVDVFQRGIEVARSFKPCFEFGRPSREDQLAKRLNVACSVPVPGGYTLDLDLLEVETEVSDSAPSEQDLTVEPEIWKYEDSVALEADHSVLSTLDSLDETPAQKDERLRTYIDDVRVEPPFLGHELRLDLDETLRTASDFDPVGLLMRKSVNSLASEAFWSDPVVTISDWRAGDSIYCPDSGALTLVEMAMDAATRLHDDAFATELRYLATADNEDLRELLETFRSEIEGCSDVAVPNLVINGVAGSAKSALAAAWISRQPWYTVHVVVPTRKLMADWQRKTDRASIGTQHQIKKAAKASVIVLDEFFALDFHTALSWLAYAAKHDKRVMCIGEENQRYESGMVFPMALLARMKPRTLLMPVSNAMPLDAATIAKGLIPQGILFDLFQTRSKVDHSITVAECDFEGGHKYDLSMCCRLTDLVAEGLPEDSVSIAQAQGSREKDVSLHLNGKNTQIQWLRQNPNQLYVAISRHTKSLALFAPPGTYERIFGIHVDTRLIVDGNYGKRNGPEPPSMIDLMVVHSVIPTGNPLALPLLYDNDLTERYETCNVREDPWTPDIEIPLETSIQAIEEFVACHSNHDAIFDHDHAIDLVVASAGSLYSLGTAIEIKPPGETRTAIEGASKLAVRQQSNCTYDDLRNVILRQATTKMPKVTPANLEMETRIALRRFKAAYYKDEYVTYPLIPGTGDWLNSRSASYIAKLLNGIDAYLESGATVKHDCFLKTQDKVKAEEGFSASLTHGQTVIASSESYNAFFGPIAKMLPQRMRERFRDDVVIDVGYSDRDLGRILRDSGLGPAFHEGNVQIDISRQDSSHSAVSLMVFLTLLSECGVPDDIVNMYAERRAEYAIRSMSPGLYKGKLRYNLPSGDPFTLICNIIQAMTVTAERFNVKGIGCIHKGDDEIYATDKLKRQRGYTIDSLRCVELKILSGFFPYHAGRFLMKDDVCVDFVRRFLKILARSDNPTISNAELHVAVLDWQIRYTEENCRNLVHAARQLYTAFNSEEITMMLSACYMLRDRNFFNAIYPKDKKPRGDLKLVEFDTDCAVSLAKELYPGRDAEFYLQFREKSQNEVVTLFKRAGKYRVHKDGTPKDKRAAPRGIHVEKDHVYALV